jgi:DNA-binding transcriptional LysR family regulator
VQTSITHSIVGPLFSQVRRDYPKIELRLMEGFSGHIEETLATGRADVGVLARYGSQADRMDERLSTDELYLVGPAGDRLLAAGSLAFKQLSGVPLVLPGAPDGLRAMLNEMARQHGVSLAVEIEVDSLTAMKEIVASGAAYTILTLQAVQAELKLKRVQAVRIVDPVLTRTLILATSAQRPLTLASRTVVSLLRSSAAAAAGAAPKPRARGA